MELHDTRVAIMDTKLALLSLATNFASQITPIIRYTFPLNLVQFQVTMGEICVIDLQKRSIYSNRTFNDIIHTYNLV